MIPDFDQYGHLPLGVYRTTLPFFKQRFVTDYNGSSTRESIFSGYVRYCAEVNSLNIASVQWIDGSYTTNKNDPNDVDLVTHVDGIRIGESLAYAEEIKRLVDIEFCKREFFCHPFFLPIFPGTDIRYPVTQRWLDYWSKWFSSSRGNKKKGFIEFDISHSSFKESINMELGVEQ